MQTFIRVTEVWTPSNSGEELRLSSGSYGALTELRENSSNRVFTYGEGLPGEAWKSASPLVLKDYDNTSFVRAEVAHKAGLTSAVAVPIFNGKTLNAVLVFLCGDKTQPNGAIEVWRDDGLSGMSLKDGYYGDLDRFESLSKHIKFPKGRGLPGIVWKTGLPLLMNDLSNSDSFLRAKGAAEAHITTGVGIPYYSSSDKSDMDAVVTFLSSNKTPIAKRFELWLPDFPRNCLYFQSAVEHGVSYAEEPDRSRLIRKGDATVGKAWQSGIPIITSGENSELTPELTKERQYTESKQYESILAIPIFRNNFLISVLAFYN